MKRSSDSSSTQPKQISATGLSVIADPPDASIDIVFVHGFTGHPERTWTHKKGSNDLDIHSRNGTAERPSKIARHGLFSRPQETSNSNPVYWPRDLLPLLLPDARVMTYGYDTNIRHRLQGIPTLNNTVYDIAGDFLVALEAKRRDDPCRRVLFIVHSLGGIVVKELLRRSSGYSTTQPHLHTIFLSTIGIVFFGTPHGGADPLGLFHIAELAIKAVGFTLNKQIVNTLLPSGERLKELKNEFGPMALERNWFIHSFQEQRGMGALGGEKVVDDASSYLNLPTIEITEHISSNHADMCRFTGLEDVEYKKVISALLRITRSTVEHTSHNENTRLTKEEKSMLFESLRFDQIDARHATIKTAHAKTCKWLLKKDEYMDWLDPVKLKEHHGFLWIKGKPGTGKSTLLKFALANAKRKKNGSVVISFFFNARGEDIEKSTLGTYRSLLLQLLQQFPRLWSVFESLDHLQRISQDYSWTVESLKTLLAQVICELKESPVLCFIDALDECDEREVREMISFMESLGEVAFSHGSTFRVLLSSRHYPHITIKRGLNLILEGQEGHDQDITAYVDSELKIGHGNTAEQIRMQLQNKASGVFIWVVLVVEILNKEYDTGSVHTLRKKLRDIPSDLYELFHDILTRDAHGRDKLILCIQWVLFAKRPLHPEELYFAILSSFESERISEIDREEVTASIIQRFILNSSKGLAEVTVSKKPTVQFIHESVRDFLLKEHELRLVFADFESNFKGQSHDRLKECCINYIGNVIADLDISTELPIASTREAAALRKDTTDRFPLLEYAVHNVLFHANTAEGYDIDQFHFLQSFQRRNWIRLDNLLQRHNVRRHTKEASLLYLLAEGNMANLVNIHPQILKSLDVEGERYGLPIFAAIATGSEDTAKVFLSKYVTCLAAKYRPNRTSLQLYEELSKVIFRGREFNFPQHRNLLLCIEEHVEETTMIVLIGTGKLDLAWTPVRKQNLLHKAAEKGHEGVIRLLLETGKTEPDSKDRYGDTPLSLAARAGHEGIVRLLLETGKTEVDSKNEALRTPLFSAARRGHQEVVKLLLQTGKAEVDSKDETGRTPLSWAAYFGHQGVVRLLLETGKAEVDLKDGTGRTPLSWAALRGHQEIERLLLSTGEVEIDSEDSF